MRNLSALASFVLTACMAVAPIKALGELAPRLPADIVVPIQIGAHTFRLPSNVIDGGASGFGKRAAVLLFMVYPKMTPWSDPSERGKSGIVPGSKAIQVLLEDPRTSSSDPTRTAKRGVTRNLLLALAENENLSRGVAEALSGTVRRKDTIGLDRFGPADDIRPNSRAFRAFKEGYHHYARIDNDEVQYVVICSGERPVPNPGCRLASEYKDLSLYITFRQPMLPEWDFIRRSVIEFLDVSSR